MENKILKFIRQRILSGIIPEGDVGIKLLGHRKYVGGKWNEIGKLQFDFMKSQGVKPSDIVIDVGCGSFRGGIHFIKYLDKGKYLGIDKEQQIVDLGLAKEIGVELISKKSPEVVVSDSFEFNKLTKKPAYGISVSLFTHLSKEHVTTCLKNLKDHVKSDHSFYATFFIGDSKRHREKSHSLAHIEFSIEEINEMASATGWEVDYIGDWGHPRDQQMIRFFT